MIMKFVELESKMLSIGVGTLADIARKLDTTPQAVSNWKSRDQVPLHIVAKLDGITFDKGNISIPNNKIITNEKEISLSDILITIAEQFKIIILIPIIFMFLSYTYVQFIQEPRYESSAKILLPENKMNNLGGISGLASQFGVNIPMGGSTSADLSSPSLYPELLKSRTFAEKILFKEFFIKKYNKKIKLINILNTINTPSKIGQDTLMVWALEKLNDILFYDKDPLSVFTTIKISVFEPEFAKELADVVLLELEKLNRFFKSQTTNEKVKFIKDRINSVKIELGLSEKKLKEFNEKNRQISSPALELAQERLTRDMEVQRGIYLTLKQQLELAKIEQIQEVSIVQVLDRPVVPLYPSNKNIILTLILSGILGIGLAFILAFTRSYLKNSNLDERKKLRRGKHFFKKKTKDFLFDRRVSGTIGLLLIICSPFYFNQRSINPSFFGMYSGIQILTNLLYLLGLIACIIIFIHSSLKKDIKIF